MPSGIICINKGIVGIQSLTVSTQSQERDRERHSIAEWRNQFASIVHFDTLQPGQLRLIHGHTPTGKQQQLLQLTPAGAVPCTVLIELPAFFCPPPHNYQINTWSSNLMLRCDSGVQVAQCSQQTAPSIFKSNLWPDPGWLLSLYQKTISAEPPISERKLDLAFGPFQRGMHSE